MSYYLKWVKISWTDSTMLLNNHSYCISKKPFLISYGYIRYDINWVKISLTDNEYAISWHTNTYNRELVPRKMLTTGSTTLVTWSDTRMVVSSQDREGGRLGAGRLDSALSSLVCSTSSTRSFFSIIQGYIWFMQNIAVHNIVPKTKLTINI